ncbi:hypothetical protein [Capnocytophaga gingivalis]|uniref:Uncharacterized protein n=1 Tax=Capnocytophaga gingivalis TaxID=1017 RepID=A0ABU5Y756_9FLAO|nr:hypothetical protein [Capnocytophaga gingivalis]MEB3039742.1 hypothetical protein [Capnocytophaga gingivalis]
MKEHTENKKKFPILAWLPIVIFIVLANIKYSSNIRIDFPIKLFIYISVGMIAWLISLANMLTYVKKYHWLVILLYCIIFVYCSE